MRCTPGTTPHRLVDAATRRPLIRQFLTMLTCSLRLCFRRDLSYRNINELSENVFHDMPFLLGL